MSNVLNFHGGDVGEASRLGDDLISGAFSCLMVSSIQCKITVKLYIKENDKMW